MMFERERMFDLIVFTDGFWTDKEEEKRRYLPWDNIEVPGLYLTFRMKVRTYERVEK